MRSSLTSSVFLLVLGCCVGVSEAICVECLEFDGQLSWCRWFNGPITGTDTEGQLGAQPNPQMNWQINSSVFSTISSDTLQDTVITCASSSLATSHTSELCTCRVCGKKFKNSLGVRIHMGRMQKDKAAPTPPSTDTTTNTQNAAVEGLLTTTTTTTSTPTSSSALINNKVPTEGQETTCTSTSTRTSTISNPTNRVSAVGRMSTTTLHEFQQSPQQSLQPAQIQQSRSLPDNTSPSARPVHSTTTRLSVMRAVKNRATLVVSQSIGTLKCICGKLLNGYRGYKSHIRACAVSKRLLISPASAQTSSTSPTVSQSASQDHTAIDVDNCRSADIHSLRSDLDFDLNSNKLNSNANLMTNNVTATT